MRTEKHPLIHVSFSRGLRHSPFACRPSLFVGAVVALLAVFAVAAVHELIPGLCLADDNGDYAACPFCKIVHALVLMALPFVLARGLFPAGDNIRVFEEARPSKACCSIYLLRAPPAR